MSSARVSPAGCVVSLKRNDPFTSIVAVSPTIQPASGLANETPVRGSVVPLAWAVHVRPPSVVARIVPSYSPAGRLLDAIRIQICRVIANESRDFADRAATERDQILAAFRERDGDLAARLMEQHITDVQLEVLERFSAEAEKHPPTGRQNPEYKGK